MSDNLPALSCTELDALLQETISEIKADIESYEERVALQNPNDGKNTDLRASEALDRPERFPGEHQVARAWLQNHSNIRIWKKKTDE